MNAVTRAGPGAAGTGIDIDEPPELLPKARDEAARRHLDVQFIKADAFAWRGTADRVLCAGASHAFSGTAAALRGLAGRVSWAGGPWSRISTGNPSRGDARLLASGGVGWRGPS
jgi:hypothetical protein